MRIIAGEWGGRRLLAPPGRETRPTTDRTREAWMSVIAGELPDARVLDLFAGSGALGLEALSRGGSHATFVERAPAALRVLEQNIARLDAGDRATVVRSDALRYVKNLDALAFDVAFADPPYGTGAAVEIAAAFARVPFASLLCVEHDRADVLPVSDAARQRRYGDTVLTFIPAPR